jgi:hypothetical protein
MRARRLSVPAERQMEDLLGVRIRDYGAAHAQNYRELILIAIDGAAADPVRFGATRIPRIRAVWEYELRHSKDRPLPDGTVEILAIVGRSSHQFRVGMAEFLGGEGHADDAWPAMRRMIAWLETPTPGSAMRSFEPRSSTFCTAGFQVTSTSGMLLKNAIAMTSAEPWVFAHISRKAGTPVAAAACFSSS